MSISYIDLGNVGRSWKRCLALAVLGTASVSAHAQWIPSQPVRIVVPYPAGGGADIVVRRIAERVKDLLGQPVIVENKPGAGTAIGAAAVQNAAPNPNLQRKLTYAPEAFVPVAALQSLPFMLNVGKQSPVTSLDELHTFATANSGNVNYGTLGIGSSNHVLGGLLGQRVAPGIVPIHYQSASQAILALMRGDIHVYFDGISTSIPRIAAGELRGLAVTSKKRVPAAELSVTIWYGLVAPAGTPPAVVQALNHAFNQVLKRPDIVQGMVADGTEPLVLSPEQFGRLIADDVAVWGAAIRQLQVKLD
jgi:tripartite-type tricarboxylate transporter receptor subunit TctC